MLTIGYTNFVGFILLDLHDVLGYACSKAGFHIETIPAMKRGFTSFAKSVDSCQSVQYAQPDTRLFPVIKVFAGIG